MSSWSLESYSNDCTMDCINFSDNDLISHVDACLKHTWDELDWAGDNEKHGVVMFLLSKNIQIPLDELEEVLTIAKKRSTDEVICEEGWFNFMGRQKVVLKEIEDIRNAIKQCKKE